MYQSTQSAFGPYTRYTLHDPATGNGFSVVPERGANVLNIDFAHFNILDGYQTPEELEAAKWGKSVLLFPFPNRLDGGGYTWEGATYEFPLNNAATGNAIHGFARDEAFSVEKINLEADSASIQCRFRYRGQRAAYPFPFVLDVVYSIQNDGIFTLEIVCKNEHDRPIPIGFGWHPYFKLAEKADQHLLHLPACEQITITDRMIPTGARAAFPDFEHQKEVGDTFLDNCFAALETGLYGLDLEAGVRRLRVEADAAQFPFFQVFTPPHRESIALEPMSCNVDAFNNGEGLVSLEAGETWTGEMKIMMNDE